MTGFVVSPPLVGLIVNSPLLIINRSTDSIPSSITTENSVDINRVKTDKRSLFELRKSNGNAWGTC